MPSKAVVTAVEARLGTSFTASDGTVLPVFGTNQIGGDTPSDGGPFIEVQFPLANGSQITIGAPGANVWREEGAVRFVLSIQRGSGVSQGLGWADDLAALFRGKQFGGVTTWAPTSPVLDNSNDSGNYWSLAFVVPYYSDIVG